MKKHHLAGKKFRLGPIQKRRKMIEEHYPESCQDFYSSGHDAEMLNLSEVMVEQAAGYMAVPMGLAGPLSIDGREYMIPLATEEPSVLAACSYIGHLCSRNGQLSTSASDPVMVAQIFVDDTGGLRESGVNKIREAEMHLRLHLEPLLTSMENRGGGWRGMDVRWLASARTFSVNLKIDVRDALGANLLNSAAEKVKPLLEDITGGKILMAILSNRSRDRTARAQLSMPVKSLQRSGFDGHQTAARIVKAANITREDEDRAITHNKGIMNGISALALATCNDTRAIEAAIHAWASRSGSYRGLSEYWIEGDILHGTLELPLPFAVTGGAVGFHPASRWALDMLENPDAQGLSRIAAAVGLVQNLAALRALVCEGIQAGHMELHARRLAFSSGARTEEIAAYTQVIRSETIRSRAKAVLRFRKWKQEHAAG